MRAPRSPIVAVLSLIFLRQKHISPFHIEGESKGDRSPRRPGSRPGSPRPVILTTNIVHHKLANYQAFLEFKEFKKNGHECLNIDSEIWVWCTSFILRHFVVSTHINRAL